MKKLLTLGVSAALALGSSLLVSTTASAESLPLAATDDDCSIVIVDEGYSDTENLTIKLSTGYTGTGTRLTAAERELWIDSSTPNAWARRVPRQTFPVGHEDADLSLLRGSTVVSTGFAMADEQCLTPGLAPLQGRPPAPSKRIGDSSGGVQADVWTINPNGTTRYGEWTSDSRYADQMVIAGDLVGAGQRDISAVNAITDKNGDGRAEFLVRHRSDASLWYYVNLGNGYLKKGIQVGRNWNGMDQIFYAGNMVVGSSKEYVLARRASDGSLWRYDLTTAGLTNGTKVGTGWGSMRLMLSPGSMWGDSAWDVVGVRKDGLMFGYRVSNGKLNSVGQIGRGWNNMVLAAVPGDVTNDGRLDLLATDQDGVLYAYRNTATGFSAMGVVGMVDPSATILF